MSGLPGPTSSPLRALPLHHQRLRELVLANPGMCLQEIADRLGLSRSATVHHVRRLIRRGVLVAVRQGRRASHFVAEHPLKTNERSLLSLIRLTTTKNILAELSREPTLAWNEIARRLRIGAHSVRWHISRLRREGVLEVHPEGEGRAHRVAVAPELLPHLSQSFGPAAPELQPAPASSLSTSPAFSASPQVKP
jgi:predicted transcriptional regulator